MQPIERTIVPDVIGEQRLATLSAGDSVQAAVEMMTLHRIGAIPIVEEGRLIGIFTERDVVARVVAPGLDPNATPLVSVMTHAPETLTPTASVRDALELMKEGHFRHLPVLDDDRLVGIVSIRDLYQSVVDQMSADIIMLAEGLLQG
jgi:CBS domain-containing protein